MWWNKINSPRPNLTGKSNKAIPPQSMIHVLEPRIMFDGAALATAIDAAHNAVSDNHPASEVNKSAEVAKPAVAVAPEPQAKVSSDNSHLLQENSSNSTPVTEVLVVDSRIPDYQQIVEAAKPGTMVIVLDLNTDGVKQIADALEGMRGIESISIVSHGDKGVLLLGNAPLFEGNIDQHAADLKTIGNAMTADGDILLYGCDVGADSKGQSFLNALSTATGADIAASTDSTSGIQKGGNWDLEIATGVIGYPAALDTAQLTSFDHSLHTASVGTLAALKAAIVTGNTDGSDDVITLTAGITFTGSSDTIAISVTDGHIMNIVGGGFTIDGASKAGILTVATSGAGSAVNISNITITNGLIVGNGANESAAATDSLGAGISNSGTLTITNSTISNNKASGGGGGGGDFGGNYAGGGGGGGGFSAHVGGSGGTSSGSGTNATAASGITGGSGAGGTSTAGGRGGNASGGAGGSYAGAGTVTGYTAGGAGATANNGTNSIGGGGGGMGSSAAGGIGGAAVGGIYNTGTLTITGSSVINNLGAGGGGGGGVSSYQAGLGRTGNGGNGGAGVGGIWNKGGTVQIDSTTNTSLSTGNVGAGGTGGAAVTGGSNGSAGSATSTLTTTNGGSQNTSYVPNATPVSTTSGGTTAFTEGNNVTSTPVAVDSGITISDSDNSTLASGTVSITGNFQNGQDVLAFTNNPATMGNISGSYTAGTGVLALSSSGATATLAQWQAALRSVTYTDSSDSPVTSNRTISFVVNDGLANSTAGTKTVSVASTNDTPIATASGGTTAFTEGNNVTSTPVVIDSGFTVSDLDSSTLSTATVSITANLQTAEDVLAFTNNPATMGNISGSYTAGTGILSLSSSGATATLAQWQAALRSITYTNSSDTPNTSNRTISFVVNDGSTSSATTNKTVSVASINDSPVSTTSGGTTAFTEGNNVTSTPVAVDSGFTVSDVDSTTLASAVVAITGNFQNSEDVLAFTNNPATMGNISASYNSSTGTMSLSSSGATATKAQWQAALRSITYTNSSETPNTSNRTISFTTNDGNTDSNTATKTVSVTSTNDTPIATASGGTTAFTEGNNVTSTPVVIDSGITVSDIDSTTFASATVAITANLQTSEDVLAFTNNPATMGNISGSYSSGTGILSLSSAGATATKAQWQAALRSVTYTNSSETPNTSNRSISFVVNDGSTNSSATVKTVSIANTNDTPVDTNTGGNTAFVQANNTTSTPVVIDSGFTVTDVDSTTLASATVAITGNFQNGEDELAFTNNPATMGNVSASYNAATGVLTLTSAGATATKAQWQVALRSVTYTDTASTVNTSNRTISFTTNDGNSDSNTSTKTVTVTATDQSPITTTSGGSTAFTEGNNVTSTPVAVDSSITLSDSDSTLASATVAITGNLHTAEDILAFTNNPATMGNISASYNSGTGVLTLSSSGATATLAQWQTALRSVTYTSSSETPNTSTRTISFTVNDGSTDSNIATKTVTVASINDSPVNTAPSSQSLSQDTSLTFNSGNSNLISISDADAGSSAIEVTLTATHGLATLSGTTGLSFTVGSGTSDITMTFTGTRTDINNALNGLIYTPTTGYNGAASLQIISNDQGNTGSGGAKTDTDTINITVNPINPVITNVTASTANGTYKIGDTVTVSATFSSVVTVDTTGGTPVLLLETGTVDHSATYVSGSGSNTLSFSYVVQAGDVTSDLDYQSTAALALNGATIRDAGSLDAVLTLPTVGAAGSLGANKALVIDGVRPTASIVVSDTALAVGETSLVTITFNEAVTGFTTADLNVANGVVSGLSSSDGGVTWTATLTPTASTTDSTNVITLDNTGVQDAAGNTGTGTTDSNNYDIDTAIPNAASGFAAIASTNTIALNWTNPVSDFASVTIRRSTTAYPVSITSDTAVISNLTGTNVSDSGLADGTYYYSIFVKDAMGNVSLAATTSATVDTVGISNPTIVVADTALKAGETSLVTITFNEAVSGFTNADLTIANGTLSAVNSSDGGTTWTATLTPNASVTDATNLITLDNTGVHDVAGNTGTGTTNSNNYAIDTARPTATIVVADTSLSVGETSLVTITFSEAVTGFTNADLTIANGTLSTVSSSDGGITWTATFTPTASITDSTNVITLDNTGVQDAAGNTGTGTTNSNNYAIDNVRPTASIAVADTSLGVGETSLVTITFSEAVTGFTNADLTIANGTLSAVSSSDGGITWTATLTPTNGITDTTNIITLANTGVQDAAGNAGTGTTDSNNYAIDTVRPTATIVVADTALKAGETSLVTLTFSEAVANFDNNDLTIANGTLSNMTTSDGGITWTGSLTPNTNITDTTNVITFDSTGVIDGGGNVGAGPIDSNNYAIDTARPTATIVVADNALAAGETSLVTITFSEAVTGFTNADLTIANGTLSAVSSSDGGIAWTATFTPTAGITDITNVITLDNTGVQDAAGNTGTGTTDSNNYVIDAQAPTVGSVSVPIGVSYNAGDVLSFTVNTSEAITVNGTPRLALDVGGTTVFATYAAGSGTNTLVFQYTVQAGDNDANGISVSSLQINGGKLRDTAGNNLDLSLNSVGNTSNVIVDTTAPTTTSIVVADTSLKVGETTTVTITFSEAVVGLDTSDFTVANGTLSNLVQINGGNTFIATLTPTANISDTTNIITLNNTGLTDIAGNAGTGTIDSNNYAIDTARPTATFQLQGSPQSFAQSVSFKVTFSEPVQNVDVADFELTTVGAMQATLGSLEQIDDHTWTVNVSNISGNGTLLLNVKNTTDVTDVAGNSLTHPTGGIFTAQSLPALTLPISTPLVTKIADAPVTAQTASPFIVLSPDASQIGGATNNTPLTTVEAPALATVVNPVSPTSAATITSFASIGNVTTSVFAANTTPTNLDTSTPGSDPIGVVTATSNGTVTSTGGGIGHLGSSGNYTASAQTYTPTIERLTSNADNTLQGLPIVARADVQTGVPLYIPIPNTAPSLDANQQLSVEVRMQDGKPLVSWMRFDPVTGSISGQAPKGFEGKLQIEIIVRDSKGNSVSSIMELQFSDKDKAHNLPVKPIKDAHKPGAHLMGKPALHEQFAQYGKGAHNADADALLSALNQISITPVVARKA